MDVWMAYERLAEKDLEVLMPQERSLVAIGGIRAVVNNGGFHQYFWNSAGDLVLDALHAAGKGGAASLVSLIQRALDVLNADDPVDRSARQQRLLIVDEAEFEALDREFYEVEETTDLDQVMSRVLASRD